MNTTLGKHVLIDFYNCKTIFKKAEDLQPLVERTLEMAGSTAENISFCHIDDELTCVAMSRNAHIIIHYYPRLAYTAVDIYSFNINIQSNRIMSAFKISLHSDRIKATSVRRGDFGSIRDMRPKRKSKITTVRRMKSTGAQIKKTSTEMLHILRHPQKTRRSRRRSK
jgi:S-adenosylmethionine decarboxylase